MRETLEQIGLDRKDLCVIRNLYWNQKTTVQREEMKTEWSEIKKGVR